MGYINSTQEDNDMKILNFDYELADGFAWISVEGRRGEELTVQCCLSGEHGEHSAEIDAADCGFDTGLCSDSNAEAAELFGSNRCFNALMRRAAAESITVLNY